MTRALALALGVTLAACSHDSMTIEVHTGDPSIVRVELVLVARSCDDCDGVAPPGAMARPMGDVYYTFKGPRFVTDVKDRIAGFALEPGADDDYLPRVGAIGFGANGAPLGIALIDRDFHIKEHLGEVFRLDLPLRAIAQAQAPTTGTFTLGDGDAVVVWRAPNAADTDASCVALEPKDGADTFVVPPEDPDCDGITGNLECDPFWYLYRKPVDGTASACFAQASTVDPCVLGTETMCVDGEQDHCAGGTICFPAVTCHDCASVFDPQCLDKVAMESDPDLPELECTIPLVDNGPTKQACPAASLPIDLSMRFTLPCDPKFLARDTAVGGVPTDQLTFDTGLGTGTVSLTAPMPSCAFQIATTGTFTAPPESQIPGVLVLHGVLRQLVVPVYLHYTDAAGLTCGQAGTRITCEQLTTTDPIFSCADQ